MFQLISLFLPFNSFNFIQVLILCYYQVFFSGHYLRLILTWFWFIIPILIGLSLRNIPVFLLAFCVPTNHWYLTKGLSWNNPIWRILSISLQLCLRPWWISWFRIHCFRHFSSITSCQIQPFNHFSSSTLFWISDIGYFSLITSFRLLFFECSVSNVSIRFTRWM